MAVARIERSAIRDSCDPSSPVPDFAEPGIGPVSLASSGYKRQRRERNADKRVILPSASTDAARVQRDALACRRSAAALAVGAFARWAQLQARLPGTWRERIVLSSSPQPGGERLSAAKRALPAPACPSPGNAPPGPVVMPVSMMPGAAQEQSLKLWNHGKYLLYPGIR
jgi:hypothetical protein